MSADMEEAGVPFVAPPGAPNLIPDIPKGDLLHRFRAYVRGARIANNGECLVTLGIDPEDKYAFMPLTDIRAMMFVVEIHDPQPLADSEGPDYVRELEMILSPQSPVFDPANVIDLPGAIEARRPDTPPFHFEED